MLSSTSPPLLWNSELCDTCPVPDIQLANACSHMVLEPRLERSFPFGKRRVQVRSYCTKTLREGFEPHIGCGECHRLPSVFSGEDA